MDTERRFTISLCYFTTFNIIGVGMVKPLINDHYEKAKNDITAKINSMTALYELEPLIKNIAREYFLPVIIKDDQKEQLDGSEIIKEMVDGKQVDVPYIIIGIPIVGSYEFEPQMVRTLSGGIIINGVSVNDFGYSDQKLITTLGLYPKENPADITYKDYYGSHIIIKSKAVESELIGAKDKVIKSLQSRNKEITDNNIKLVKLIEELAKRRRKELSEKEEEASELTHQLRNKISDIKW